MRRRISIALACLVFPVAVHAAWDYFESRRLFGLVDELRRQGEPVSRDALGRWQRPTAPDEIRAARYYSAAGELAFRDWTFSNGPTEKIDRRPIVRISGMFAETAEKRTLKPAAATMMKTVVEDQVEALEMMDRAAPLPFTRFPPHAFEDYPRTYSLEHLADAATARTVWLTSQGDGDGAARSLWSTLKLRRAHVRTVPWQSEHLIELQYLLEHARPAVDSLRQVQDALRERERPDATVDNLRESRAIAVESLFTEWYGRRTDPLTPAEHARWAWQPLSVLRPWVARQATRALRASQEAVAAAQQPWPANIAALRALGAKQPDSRSARGRPSIVDFGRYIIRGVGDEGVVRDGIRLTHVRAGMAALAVERYRRDHADSPPDSLAALVPTYLPSVPTDPFTGRELLYRTDRGRFVIYSLGPDGNDNGGEVSPLPTHVWKVTTPDIGLEIRRQD